MKKIIITQRSFFDSNRNEYIDGLDQQWVALFGDKLSLMPMPSRTLDPQRFMQDMECDGILLSGGNCVVPSDPGYSEQRLFSEKALLSCAKENQIPVVGICYGMQVLNYYGGGTIRKIENHTKKSHAVKINADNFEVNSYHNYAIFPADLACCFEPLAQSDDTSIEAIVHRELPWLGIMWHPERPMKKQHLWIDLIKKIFLGDLKINVTEISKFLNSSNESY